MESPVVVALVCGSVVLAILMAVLCFVTWNRVRRSRAGNEGGGRRRGSGVALAVGVGTVTLGLGLLNAFQYARSLVPPSDREVIDRFSKLFYDNPNTLPGRKWLGVDIQQNPNDAWIHQEIIVELAPDFIIEAGTAAGGSAILWASILREVNPDGRVITLDIVEPSAAAVNHHIWKERVEFIKGSSTEPTTVAKLAERVRGKKVLVILDSHHVKDHVLNELRAYSPMVNVGAT
jgi:hypothetical protein